jgi:hypothetical protein
MLGNGLVESRGTRKYKPNYWLALRLQTYQHPKIDLGDLDPVGSSVS